MNHKTFPRFGRVALAALMFCSLATIAVSQTTAPPDIPPITAPDVTFTNPSPNPDFNPNTDPLPTTTADYWKYTIALVSPIIVWGFARFGPSVPVFVLPLLAPLVGLILGGLMNWLGKAAIPWVDMVQAGGLAVWIRELTNQLVTKRFAGEVVKKTGLIILAVGLAIGSTGCLKSGKLEPGGAYAPAVVVPQPGGGTVTNATAAPDMVLYSADAAFDFVYTSIESAFEFERNNRALLWQVSPEIKRKLDQLRPQVTARVTEWAKARKAYLANPIPANQTALEQALAQVRSINAAVLTAIPQRK